MADVLATDVSNYSRKESGDVKITEEEWNKLSKFLGVSLEDIYEEEGAIKLQMKILKKLLMTPLIMI